MSSSQGPPQGPPQGIPQFPPGYLEENLGPMKYGVAIMFTILVTIAVALRFWSRRLGKISWKWDDLLIGLAYFFFLAVISADIVAVACGGAGRHLVYILMTDPAKITVILKMFLAIPLIYLVAVALPKLALLSIYLDIFTSKPLRIICWVCVGITVANWFASTIATFVACTPYSYRWTQITDPTGGTCIDLNALFRWASFPNIITDLIMLVLPIPMVLQLQVSMSVRIGVAVTFLLGSSGLIASIFRFVFFYSTNAVIDLTYSAVVLLIWTEMEVAMYIIATCLLAYRPLLKFFGLKIKTRRSNGSTPLRPTKNTDQSNTGAKSYPSAKYSSFGEEEDQEEDDEERIALSGAKPAYQNNIHTPNSVNDSFLRDPYQTKSESYDPTRHQQQQLPRHQPIPKNRIGVATDISMHKS